MTRQLHGVRMTTVIRCVSKNALYMPRTVNPRGSIAQPIARVMFLELSPPRRTPHAISNARTQLTGSRVIANVLLSMVPITRRI